MVEREFTTQPAHFQQTLSRAKFIRLA